MRIEMALESPFDKRRLSQVAVGKAKNTSGDKTNAGLRRHESAVEKRGQGWTLFDLRVQE
jgi:hypothetical protein